MLGFLHIQNFAIIDDLEVEFSPGLNVVTGETGAGKSIVMEALQVLLGLRADKSFIRAGKEFSNISGIFHLDKKPDILIQIKAILNESGVSSCSEGQLIISRKLTTRSTRNFANSCPVSAQLLRQICDLLVDVHGPYDHQSLVRPQIQQELLDLFGNCTNIRKKCFKAFQHLQSIQRQIKTFKSDAPTPERIDLLRFQLDEIDAANFADGEDTEIEATHTLLANGQEILEILTKILDGLNSEHGVTNLLTPFLRDLKRLQNLDPREENWPYQSLEKILNTIHEFSNQLSDYAEKIDVDPMEFSRIEDRMALLQKLKQKYGGSLKAIKNTADNIRRELHQFENQDQLFENLKKQEDLAINNYLKYAKELSNLRHGMARNLEKRITEKLQFLGFEKCTFSIEVHRTENKATGIDQVKFLFAPNVGEGSKPLQEIASAGEISRVMLAIKAVLAKEDQIPILIFDEIDVNIGGEVAAKVGIELAKLSNHHQILCITHLAQVAVKGRNHFCISKSITNGRTRAKIALLSQDERIHEVARMLGGKESTSVILKHAAELLKIHGS